MSRLHIKLFNVFAHKILLRYFLVLFRILLRAFVFGPDLLSPHHHTASERGSERENTFLVSPDHSTPTEIRRELKSSDRKI